MSTKGRILLLITLIDTFVTAVGINLGILREVNANLLWIINHAGLFLFVMFKSMFSLLVIAILDRRISQGGDKEKDASRGYNLAIIVYGLICVLYLAPIFFAYLRFCHLL
ncbi:MAG: hypothetical protein HZA94_00515 [Candidatus Vogelbacteria bacterium]|nr:hypothetical protein [Candidatus Vogelbacteria bacterium]